MSINVNVLLNTKMTYLVSSGTLNLNSVTSVLQVPTQLRSTAASAARRRASVDEVEEQAAQSVLLAARRRLTGRSADDVRADDREGPTTGRGAALPAATDASQRTSDARPPDRLSRRPSQENERNHHLHQAASLTLCRQQHHVHGLSSGCCHSHERVPCLSILCLMRGRCQTSVKWSEVRFNRSQV